MRELAQRSCSVMLACLALAWAVSNAAAQDTQAAAPSTASDADKSIEGYAALGLGLTQRSVDYATNAGPHAFHTGFVPALEVRVGAAGRVSEALSLDVGVAYASSIFAQARETPTLSSERTTSLRTHHLELGVLPLIIVVDGAVRFSIGAFVGYGLRAFSTVVELSTPRYTLHGPLVRGVATLAFLHNRLRLLVAPEAQLIVSISQDLLELARLQNAGQAYGVEVSIMYDVNDWLGLALRYRRSTASAHSALDRDLSDIEDFLTADVVLRM